MTAYFLCKLFLFLVIILDLDERSKASGQETYGQIDIEFDSVNDDIKLNNFFRPTKNTNFDNNNHSYLLSQDSQNIYVVTTEYYADPCPSDYLNDFQLNDPIQMIFASTSDIPDNKVLARTLTNTLEQLQLPRDSRYYFGSNSKEIAEGDSNEPSHIFGYSLVNLLAFRDKEDLELKCHSYTNLQNCDFEGFPDCHWNEFLKKCIWKNKPSNTNFLQDNSFTLLAFEPKSKICPQVFSSLSDNMYDVFPDREFNIETPNSGDSRFSLSECCSKQNLNLATCTQSGTARDSTLPPVSSVFGLKSFDFIDVVNRFVNYNNKIQNLTKPTTIIDYPCLSWKNVINLDNYAKVFDFITNGYLVDDDNSNLVTDQNKEDFYQQTRLLDNVCAGFSRGQNPKQPLSSFVSCPILWDPLSDYGMTQSYKNLYLFASSSGQPKNEQRYFMISPCSISQSFVENAVETTHNLSPCEACPAGSSSCFFGQDCGNICHSCTEGHYQDETGQSSCKRCPIGFYSDLKGQTECKLCIGVNTHFDCHPGDCAEGTFYDNTSTICRDCTVGTYQDEVRRTSCKICNTGTFQDQEIQSGCKLCFQGTYSDFLGESLCKACAVGTFQNEMGQIECDACQPGTYENKVDTISSCIMCDVGTYADTFGESLCKKCAAGTIQNKTAQPKCDACQPGTYQGIEATTECNFCAVSYYASEYGESECKMCSRGKFGIEAGQTDCKLCSRGTYQNDRAKSKCIHCAAGTYENEVGASECKECIRGTFIGTSGKKKCIACERGKFANLKGEKECKKCILGTFASDVAESECTECDFGTYENEKGKSECKICQYGKFINVQGKTRCKKCEAGTYADERGEKNCKECQLGTYGEQSEMRQCFEAANGNYVDQTGQTAPKDSCPLGTFAPYCGLSKCVECYEGFASSDVERCAPCVTGKYQDERGQYNTGGSQTAACKTCPDDQTGFEPGQPFCLCNPGKYTIRPGKCGRCTGQEYQDDYGQAHCKTCPDFFMPLPSHVECVPVTEEITRTCLMVFWVPECYKQGIHPITIILWLVVIILFYYSTRTAARKLWEFIWT